jgi:AcrR family transcriptional regulator
MGPAAKTLAHEDVKTRPRDRILAVAADLFYRHGIRAVGVDAIADAAKTNKMTLYRHFASKDELVAEYLRCVAENGKSAWERLDADHPGDALAQLRAWLRSKGEGIESGDDRGCPFANTAVEFPEKDHPARRVIETYKRDQRDHLARLAITAGLAEPEMLADELFLLLEGAYVTAQSMGGRRLGERVIRMGEAMIKAHLAMAPQGVAAG